MARVLSASEQAALGTSVAGMHAHARGTHVRLEIEDAAGVMQDLTHVLHSFSYRTDADATVIGGTVTLSRWHTDFANSLSPIVTDALDAGRAIKLYLTTLLHSDPEPAPEDLKLVWDAEIDRVDAGSEYIELVVRDVIGATLADMELTKELRYESVEGGWEWGALLEDVLIEAKRLTDPASGPGDPIVPTDFDDTGATVLEPIPDTAPSQWPRLKIEARRLLDVVRELANRIGWQLRPRWHEGDSEFKLALYEPPHDKATVDWYIPKSRYIVIPQLARDRDGVRNAARVHYIDAAGMERIYPANEFWDDSVEIDADSIADYGFRFASFVEDESSPIKTEAQAAALVALFFGDAAQPPVDADVETPLNWAVDLDDRVTLEANDDHFETDQTYAVVGYSHELGPDRERTRLTLRGKPTGGLAKWRRRRMGDRPPARPDGHYALYVKDSARGDTVYVVQVQRGPGIANVAYWFHLDAYPMDEAIPDDLGAPEGVLLVDESEITVPHPPARHVRWLRLTGYDSAGTPRATLEVPFDPQRETLPSLEHGTLTETDVLGTFGVIVENPSGIPWQLWVRKRIGGNAASAQSLVASGTGTGAEFIETVAIESGTHRSLIEFQLVCTIEGLEVILPPLAMEFDRGYEANITQLSYEFRGNRLWLIVASVDSDTRTSGITIIGNVEVAFSPLDPTLASHDFSLSDAQSGEIDTGQDVSNPGEGLSMIGVVAVRAIDIKGVEGPVRSLTWRRFGTAPPAASIDTLVHTKAQGGTACTTDPAQSSIEYDVTAGGTDTVTLERWVDGVLDATVLNASATHAQTFIDDHDFFEVSPPVDEPIHEVKYRLIVKNSGGDVLTSEWTDSVIFEGVEDC